MYQDLNPGALKALLSAKSAAAGRADPSLVLLAELRVSQLNGCAYCVDLHTRELLALGFSAQKIACLTVWKESGLFNPQESAVLALAEGVTKNPTGAAQQGLVDKVTQILSAEAAVDLAYRIATMNALNRLSITFKGQPAERPMS